eukprot:3556082-Rhodomonas_salina.1
MGSCKGPVANATKKHELACLDARIPSFTAHRDEMQQHMSSYKDTYGTADEEKFKSASYIDVRTFKEAMASAVEDHLLELHKQ